MKKKLIIFTVLIASLALIMGGCQNDNAKATPVPSPTNETIPTPTPETSPITSKYSVSDSQGNIIHFDSTPETVISLAPNVTEIIFALGAGDKLIARTDWCNYPEEVVNYASVGNIDQPDVEKIIEMSPDIVLLSEITMKEIALQIKDAGIPFFVIDNESSFEGAFTSIKMVGSVLKLDAKADEIVSSMKSTIESVKSTVAAADKKSVYYVMGYGEYGDFTAGKGTFISEMIAAAGGINVADDTEGWTYSIEKIIEHNPDVLLLSTWAPAEGLKETNGYKDLTAVKENRMYTLDDDTLQRLGPRLSEAFADMAKAIHPDLFE